MPINYPLACFILVLVSLLAAIPFAGIALGAGLLAAINLIEVVLVLTTQRRIGDNIAKTVVVRA